MKMVVLLISKEPKRLGLGLVVFFVERRRNMGIFLDSFIKTMPKIQQKALRNLLNMDKGNPEKLTRKEFEDQIIKFEGETREAITKQKYQFIPQDEQLDSKLHNKGMSAIQEDLFLFYQLSETLDSHIKDHQYLSSSEMTTLLKVVEDIELRVEEIERLTQSVNKLNEYIIEDMRVPKLLETDQNVIYQIVGNKESASTDQRGLTLKPKQAEDQLISSYGEIQGKINVNGTAPSIYHKDNTIEKALDSSLESYWMYHAMTDTPIVSNTKTNWLSGNSYKESDGLVVEIEIRLDKVMSLSSITLKPFAAYPLELYGVYLYSNRDYAGERTVVLHYDNAITFSKELKLDFASQAVGSVIIVLRQKSYTRESYIMNTEDIRNQELWHALTTDESLVEHLKDPGETIEEFNLKQQMTGFSLYKQIVEEWADKINDHNTKVAIEDILDSIRKGISPANYQINYSLLPDEEGKKRDVFQEVRKYSYIIGLYQISFMSEEYYQESTTLTKELPLSINLNRITLEVDEEHIYRQLPFGDRMQLSDIQYDFAVSGLAWRPILPTTYKRVENEILSVAPIKGESPVFKEVFFIALALRFKLAAKNDIQLKRNGETLPNDSFVISEDRKHIGIKSMYYMPAAIFSVSYLPSRDSYTIAVDDLLTTRNAIPYTDEKGQLGENFEDVTFSQPIELQYTPYIPKKSYIEVSEKDGSIIGLSKPVSDVIVWCDGHYMHNITNYVSGSYDPNDLQLNDGYSFAQIGNKIYLGQPEGVTHFEKVKVDYNYKIMNMRMRIVMKRGSYENVAQTPILKKYTIVAENKNTIGEIQ